MAKMELLNSAVPNTEDALRAIGSKFNGRMVIERTPGLRVWIGSRGPDVDPPRRAWAEQLLELLNKEAWLDGMWAVAWVDFSLGIAGYSRAVMIYLDKDCDVQFTVDMEDRFEVLLFETFAKIEDAILAYGQWREHMRTIQVSPDQKIKAAQGQRSVDRRPQPDVDPLAW